MSDSQKKRIEEGPPIWVESLLTKEEHKEIHKKYPQCVPTKEPVLYDPSHHKGGKWRYKMGQVSSEEEIKDYNKKMDKLHEMMKTKAFERRPDYGTHNEARP